MVLSVLSSGELNKFGKIEIDRLMLALRPLTCEVSLDEMQNLVHATRALDGENKAKKEISYFDFLERLKKFIEPPSEKPLENEEDIIIYEEGKDNPPIEDMKQVDDNLERENMGRLPLHKEDEIEKFKRRGTSPTKHLEFLNFDQQVKKYDSDDEEYLQEQGLFPVPKQVKTPEPEEENIILDNQDDEEEEEDEDWPSNLSLEWNQGKFDIVINHCHDCYLHFGNTRHFEEEFINKFNEIGQTIKEIYPNANIIGNRDKINVLGGFDVYVMGVGPLSERDEYGKYFLFTKKEKKRLPSAKEITDLLTILVFSYGDSVEIENSQADFYRKYSKVIPKAYEKMHDFPCGGPERVIKPKEKVMEKGDSIKMVCKHSGCGQQYMDDKNPPGSCQYHPGRYLFGSIHALWPEGWTCCDMPWATPGCRAGVHAGIPKSKDFKLCVNHGEKNPRTTYPDSFCGFAFKEDDNGTCSGHSGYLHKARGQKIAFWTCCKEPESEAQPCQTQEHRGAEWPDEEAKIYFYDKPLLNPGVTRNAHSKNKFHLHGRKSGYFRNTIPYNAKTAPVQRLTKDEQDKLNRLPRYCLNWACEKVYTEEVNNKKACKHHPGRWDFGHTGLSTTHVFESSNNNLMWEPHWTCCRKKWEDEGCSLGRHNGPFMADLKPEAKKFKWPDRRTQVYFKKKVSSFWQDKLNNDHVYDKRKIEMVLKEIEGNRGNISTDALPTVCDKLHLHLLVCSEDISYQFKFQQVINGSAQSLIDDGNGYIDKEKFLKWWFMTADELLDQEQK